MSTDTPDRQRKQAEEALRKANAERARARRRLAALERKEQAKEREREAERERIVGRVLRRHYGSWDNPKLQVYLNQHVTAAKERALLGLPPPDEAAG
jgi:septal ring factor EnvC (AmiA/AmiB activator)